MRTSPQESSERSPPADDAADTSERLWCSRVGMGVNGEPGEKLPLLSAATAWDGRWMCDDGDAIAARPLCIGDCMPDGGGMPGGGMPGGGMPGGGGIPMHMGAGGMPNMAPKAAGADSGAAFDFMNAKGDDAFNFVGDVMKGNKRSL